MKKTFELKRCHIDIFLLFLIFFVGTIIAFRKIKSLNSEKYYDLKQDDLTELFTINNCESDSNQGSVILFYTNWCGASRKFMGIDDNGKVIDKNAVWPILSNERQFDCNNDRIKMEAVNCDTPEGSRIAELYKVKYLPSLFFQGPLGEKPVKYTGETNLPAIKKFITNQYNVCKPKTSLKDRNEPNFDADDCPLGDIKNGSKDFKNKYQVVRNPPGSGNKEWKLCGTKQGTTNGWVTNCD